MANQRLADQEPQEDAWQGPTQHWYNVLVSFLVLAISKAVRIIGNPHYHSGCHQKWPGWSQAKPHGKPFARLIQIDPTVARLNHFNIYALK